MPRIDHLDLVVSSLERSLPFYRGLLEPLGWSELNEVGGERGETIRYLSLPGERGEVGLREKRSDSHGVPYERYGVGVHHVAFEAASRDSVDERHRWCVEQGVDVESPPREYEYTPGYYAFFLFDPDGIKLEVVHRPEKTGA